MGKEFLQKKVKVKFNLKEDEHTLVKEVVSAIIDELSLGKESRGLVECPYPISAAQRDAIRFYLRKDHRPLAEKVVIESGVRIGSRTGALVKFF